jgi:outer membrane lipoprotein-sorting protein
LRPLALVFAVLALASAGLLAPACLAAPAGQAAAADPPKDPAWKAIETFRGNLARQSPFTAKFVQTYLPEGFSTGEKESGRMALHLPDCLRWDYDEPYPKSFILCGDVIHYWNQGEKEGQTDEIDADHEPGLDLLLVGVDELQRRYGAALKRSGDGVAITLRPTTPNEFVAEATLEIDAELERLLVLRYVDPEGNRTEFRLSGYRPGVETGTFNPPKDVEFLDEY